MAAHTENPQFISPKKKVALAMALWLGACAHNPKPEQSTSQEPPEETQQAGRFHLKPSGDMATAAMQPLEDVGLKRDKVPPALKAIKTPYADESTDGCDSIAQAILALDLVLGPDIDVKLAEQGWRKKGIDAAGDALADAVESTSTSVIPFRGWVREISGATRRERRMSAAIQAGKLRRAYLKGIGQAQGCAPPAAPLPYADK